MASFMSGMAGNVTAFNTVWTYDIYQAYLRPKATDSALLWMGRAATVVGIARQRGSRLFRGSFQQHHGLAPARLRFRQRTTLRHIPTRHVLAAHDRARRLLRPAQRHTGGGVPSRTHPTTRRDEHPGQGRLARPRAHVYPSEMAQNFWTAIFAWTTCFVVTILISLVTRQQKSDVQLTGLVSSLTPRTTEADVVWYKRPAALGVLVLFMALILNILFW